MCRIPAGDSATRSLGLRIREGWHPFVAQREACAELIGLHGRPDSGRRILSQLNNGRLTFPQRTGPAKM